MKKAIIIGVACLTAGIGLAGCGASSNTGETTETTTTAEVTTTSETTTAEPTTTTTTEAPTTTTTEAPTTTAKAHPEDDQIMENLRAFYKSHEIVDGVPVETHDNGETTSYLKFAIADFDGDGENEVAIEDYRYSKEREMDFSFTNIYKGDISKENVLQYFRQIKINDVIYLDNGIAKNKRDETYMPDVDGNYFIINKDYYSKLNYSKDNLGSDTSTYCIAYDKRNGEIHKCLGNQGDTIFDVVKTQAEYEADKELLNSGNVMNIEVKDFTAENLGL